MTTLDENQVEKILQYLRDDDMTKGDLAEIECIYSEELDLFVEIVRKNISLFTQEPEGEES